jgi:hypothetical protein
MIHSNLLWRGVLLTALLGALGGCMSDRPEGMEDGDGRTQRPSFGDGCLTRQAGCPCDKEGAIVECGVTVSEQKDTATCRMGERLCEGGEWSECLGEKLTQIYRPPPSAPGLEAQALAASAVDCMDKCDPYCWQLADTPDGLPETSTFKPEPGGLALKGSGFTSTNCPDVVLTPDTDQIEISTIDEATGAIGTTPGPYKLNAKCGLNGAAIVPSWKTDKTDRSYVSADGTLNFFQALPGNVVVTASGILNSDTSTIGVKVNVRTADPAVTPAIKTAFEGAGSVADVAKTLYPYRNTVLPIDLKAPVVQWAPNGTPAANVEVVLRYPAGAGPYTFYYSKIFAGEPTQGPLLQVAGAPAWAIPQVLWTAFGRTAVGNGAEIVIQRRTAATLYNEMVIPVRFATAPLRGTVYYTQYVRKLFEPGNDAAGNPRVQSGQTDLPENYNPLVPYTTDAMGVTSPIICPVGNNTHMSGSTTRAIDMSTPNAANSDPLGGGGCPVCHSVSANGNRFVAGSRFLQTYDSGTNPGFVANTSTGAMGATFTGNSEALNYSTMLSSTSWNSRGFAFAALTPDGTLALQGPGWWGNSEPYAGTNLTVDRAWTAGGKIQPMFFVPTMNPGAYVFYATTAALSANRSGNVLTSTADEVFPTIDGVMVGDNESILVKDQVDQRNNGVYTLSVRGTAAVASGEITSAVVTTVTASTAQQAATNAFDNNGGSRWESVNAASPNNIQWIRVDLGTSRAVTAVQISWEAANARDYKIQGSNNDSTWTDLSTQTGVGGSVARNETIAVSGSYRYIRVYCTLRNNNFGYSIYEMNVWGPLTGAPWKLTRRADAQDTATVEGKMKKDWEVKVTRGNTNYAKVFRLTSPTTDPVVNTDNLVFTDVNATQLPVMTMPAISPDGKKIVYVSGDSDSIASPSSTTAWRKGLTMLTIDDPLDWKKRTVSAKTRLLNNWVAGTGGIPIKWPFFEHDSRSVVFVETDVDEYCDTGRSSGTDAWRACFGDGPAFANAAPTQRGYWPGRLYSIDSQSPAGTKTALTKLNAAEVAFDANKAFQPTVLPFESGGYRWVIFTSPRSYGNQLNQNSAAYPTHFTCASTLLWIAALDNTTAGSVDRSHPAFLVPGQNLQPIARMGGHYLNERGYLVPSPCKSTGLECTADSDCCAGTTCQVNSISASGMPVRTCKSPVSGCSMSNGACLTDADCCSGAPCNQQKCQAVPAYATSTYTRTYVASCPSGFKPEWGLFSYHATTSSDSHITFKARTAVDLTGLATATQVTLQDTTADNATGAAETVDVGDKLAAVQVSSWLNYLDILMTFYPGAMNAVSPILHDWDQRYRCVPAE